MKTALITGISGQDGQYLAKILQENSYKVVGTSRDPSKAAQSFIANQIAETPTILQISEGDDGAIASTIAEVAPDEIYNLAAYAVGSTMWDEPVALTNANGITVTHILEAIRHSNREIRFCQASSSEIFGHAKESPQSELTPCHPRSPYGAAKLYAHNLVNIYREHHGLFACSAILFNHESPIRSRDFVTRLITYSAARIRLGLLEELPLGNLEASRDWGYAEDYMNAAWLMLQHGVPLDYVVATGETHTVRELCDIAFSHLGLSYRDHVTSARQAWRATEQVPLVGDSSRLRETIGWVPKLDFQIMIENMVDRDLKLLQLNEGEFLDGETD